MILLSAALAAPEGTAHIAVGNRLESDGVGGAGGITESVVIGGDGGTLGTTVAGRYASEDLAVGLYVPFASYRVADKRRTNLGNLRVEGFWRMASDRAVTLVGLELHLPTGSAWTWTNDAVSFWRSGGITGVFQRRQMIDDHASLILRGALGVHATPGFDPVPRVYPHVSMAVGVDHDLHERFGYTTEVAFSAWDPSPFDIGAWARAEPIDGLQLRLGGILPVGTWLGAAPTERPGGLRELTVSGSISVAP